MRRREFIVTTILGVAGLGYACDNDAGIYFEDNDVKRVVATRPNAKVYYVSRVGGRAVERVMEPDLIA